MRRNMELIKVILQKLEDKETMDGDIGAKAFPNYPPDDINYHIAILYNAGLIEGREIKHGLITKWVANRLTWQGHDFLDAAKNETIWNKAKEVVKEKGGIFSLEILKKILAKFAMEYVFPSP